MIKILFLIVVALGMIVMSGCHTRRERNDASHLTQTDYAIPEDVKQKLPVLAKEDRFDEALRLLRPYAEQGDPQAQFDMAIGLIERGGKVNNREVIKWVRKAAAQGLPQALGFLSNAYRWGEYGLHTDSVVADMWESARTNTDLIPKCLIMYTNN